MRSYKRTLLLLTLALSLVLHPALGDGEAQTWGQLVVIITQGADGKSSSVSSPVFGFDPYMVLYGADGSVAFVAPVGQYVKPSTGNRIGFSGGSSGPTKEPLNGKYEVVDTPEGPQLTFIPDPSPTPKPMFIISPDWPTPSPTPNPEVVRREKYLNRNYYNGIATSDKWLKQMYIDFVSWDARLYENTTLVEFKQALSPASDGGVRMTMSLRKPREQITLRISPDTLRYFQSIQLSELVILNGEGYDGYPVAAILMVLEATQQSDARQIWLSGDQGAVYVIDKDGFKTQLAL